MVNAALKSVGSKKATATPQSQKAVKGQKKNSAGGFTFVLDDMARAKRFLILGSDASYYRSGEEMSKDNAKVILKLAANDEQAIELVDLIEEISLGGRAASQEPGLFALALVATNGSPRVANYAYSKLSAVARTGSSLFTFIGFVMQFRKGMGSGLQKAVRAWYLDKSTSKLAYQMVKYQSRNGWSHADLLKMSRPKSEDAVFNGLASWAIRGELSDRPIPTLVQAFEQAKTAEDKELTRLILDNDLSWEMLPSESLNKISTWEALFAAKSVPVGALVRQLSRLSRIGYTKPLSKGTSTVVNLLTSAENISYSRIHPITVLTAMKAYAQGWSYNQKTHKSTTWDVNQKIVDALNEAFYLAFGNVEAAGKRNLIGLDVSGSMGISKVQGNDNLTAREATSALAMVIARTEPETHVIGFTGGYGYGGKLPGNRYYGVKYSDKPSGAVKELAITPKQRLDDVMRTVSDLPFGPTDCALPMLYAMEKGLEVDVFTILTDNDTWIGAIHPHEALVKYRELTGIPAKLVVLSTTATRFSIADPSDAGMLDIPGFDSAVPNILNEFARG